MDAITKNYLPEELLVQMTQAAFPEKLTIRSIEKLSGGFCSAVYGIVAEQGKMVLKVASADGVKMMRHERRYLPVEAEMLSTLKRKTNILMPELLYYDDSRLLCPVPYFLMSHLEGRPLNASKVTPEQYSRIREQIGRFTREICELKAEKFGLPQIPESNCDKNADFVLLLFDWLLRDAAEKAIPIPGIAPAELMHLIAACSEALNQVEEPRYIHTDTWDGNVMVKDGELTGLVDYAAILYGDPLMSHDFHDFGDAPNPDFLRGYGQTTFSEAEKLRIQVYRIWQRLGMVVERGYREYSDSGLYGWVLGEFEKEVEMLKGMR